MKNMLLHRTAAALLPVALLALTACSSTPQSAEVHKTTVVAVEPGVPGGVTVDTYQSTATVTAINAATRKVTVVSPNGAMATFTAGPKVVNFDQIRVGDQIRATLTKEQVVFLRPAGEAVNDGAVGAVARSVPGEKPGLVLAGSVETTTMVQAIDLKRHAATLLYPDGTTKTVIVRPDVDLTQAKLGQQVVIRTTESVAFLVEKP